MNLGNLYLPLRAVDESPVFAQAFSENRFVDQATQSLHVALVKIRAPQSIDELTLQGVGHTISQLTQLGLSCGIVVDCDDGRKLSMRDDSHLAVEQADRIVKAIDRYGGQGARQLDCIVGVLPSEDRFTPSVKVQGKVRVTHRNLLLAPLRRGVTPVIVPVGFTSETQTLVPIKAGEVLLALSRELAGIQPQLSPEADPQKVAEKITKLQRQISLDRIILLDPLGGIPSLNGLHESHLFINLEQEYKGINDELVRLIMGKETQDLAYGCSHAGSTHNVHASSSPIFGSFEVNPILPSLQDRGRIPDETVNTSNAIFHAQNLNLLKDALSMLPPSSSALLTTPQEAASFINHGQQGSRALGVGTRRQRNPLIHNLLTDKPVLSSSLPSARTPKSKTPVSNTISIPSPATFVKRGMPVTIIPDPLVHPWKPPASGSSSLQLTDPRVDLPRLVHLIEDSFSRKLDVSHYFSRIKGNLAGIIIAGEYEGGAILTWETGPSSAKMVPYLDKFAVLKRSQGAGGVADIVFNAMVRDCFPEGLCWRSRKDNPVNKWYFERAKGTWKIPGMNWTMFWTTEGVQREIGTFLDYERICRNVVPSWADNLAVVD